MSMVTVNYLVTHILQKCTYGYGFEDFSEINWQIYSWKFSAMVWS